MRGPAVALEEAAEGPGCRPADRRQVSARCREHVSGAHMGRGGVGAMTLDVFIPAAAMI